MKKTRKTTREDYTLFQDIMDTYRYPDGTLNKVAVFISTLALILLITVGHFVIDGIKNISKMNTVTASELTIEEIQDYITNSYLDAISKYGDGNINQDKARENILKMLAEYLESSNGFTDQQQEALNHIIEEYLLSTTIYEDVNQNSNAIRNISNLIENKYSENKEYISQLKELLLNEISANTNIDESHYKELNEQIEKLQNYADNRMAENNSNLNSMINELRRTYENSLGAKDYGSENIYNAGDYVIYNERLYISTIDNNSSSPENADNWKLSDLDEIISNLQRTAFEEMERMYKELSESLAEQNQYLTNQINETNENLTNQINDTSQNLTNLINDSNQNLTNQINDSNQNLTNQINDSNAYFSNEINTVNQTISNQGNDFQAQIDAINDLLHDNNMTFEFGYNSQTGAYGYYVNGQFKPF
ncbi:hypothetical protein SAMN05660668_00788 [Pseudobutyrivibrio sp. AR14]|uniref:hypothetical protein n=1 Tax=Pseudobutyrivibrio sp. AR14 TaxID=1520804 RepID=UPI000887ED85|nr:hypothetical protein [Pseudobutyrivibrio sp. AR14]SCX91591.1 hypothetical protein SAMN05660668_00788 [Pseudobutyrivibrio sp. AR14]